MTRRLADREGVLSSPAEREAVLESPADREAMSRRPADREAVLGSPAEREFMLRIPIDRDALLLEAHERVVRRRDLAAAGQRSAEAQAELAGCIAQGWQCVRELARPAAAFVPLRPSDLPPSVAGGRAGHEAGRVLSFAYLVTCGYDSREALRRLDGDYASYHFQDAFARELVFALGREVARALRAAHPHLRLRRVVIGDSQAAACRGAGAAASRWDPASVAALLRRLGADALGVGTLARGGLAPLHSVLGVMTGGPQSLTPTVSER